MAGASKKQHHLPETSLHEELASRGVRFVRGYDHGAFEVPEDVAANRRRLAASQADPYVSGMYVIDVSLPLFDALEQFEKTITSEKSLEAAVKSDLVRHHIRESLKHIYEGADRVYGVVQARINR
ncbi:MAG: hypothetical protein L3J76_01195 [Candidatus Hydrothermae bacterium]|nr:hypothetical protein [Candidatus Hydrothermae bacterium]